MDIASTSTAFDVVGDSRIKNVLYRDSDSSRQVDHFLITWTINDFLKLKSFTEKSIRSPPIQADFSSDSWFIVVFPHFLFTEENKIQFCLLRDASSNKCPVVVTYRFGIKKSKITWFQEKSDVTFLFNSSSLILCDILEYFESKNYLIEDKLTVLCEMYIAYNQDINRLSERKASAMTFDLLDLSLDLFNLSKKPETSDVVVQVKDLVIPVHKAILAARSAVFAKMVTNDGSIINISEEDYNHIENILAYIYSANFYWITFNGINIGLYECAKRFKIQGLIQLLTPMQMDVSSFLKEENVSFTWKVHNFSSLNIKEECITSSPFHAGSKSSPVWYLDIYPNGCHRNSSSVGIVLRTKDMSSISGIKMHVSIVDELKQELYTKNADKPLNPNFVYGFPDYISKRELYEKEILRDGKLIINCKIRSLYMTESYDRISSVSQPLYEEYACFEQLSADMEKLLLNGGFSDCTLMATDVAMFSVHRAILSMRSTVFEILIKKAKDDNYVLGINDVSPEVLEEIICFCYTGKIKTYKSSFSIELYKGARIYKIARLAVRCVNNLLYTVNERNLCEVIAFAHKHEEIELYSRCLIYLKTVCDKKLNTKDWKKFVEKERNLADEICKWLQKPIDKPSC